MANYICLEVIVCTHPVPFIFSRVRTLGMTFHNLDILRALENSKLQNCAVMFNNNMVSGDVRDLNFVLILINRVNA